MKRKIDALIFTGGIGENDSDLRLNVIENFSQLGMEIDREENLKEDDRKISSPSSKVDIFVINTNEEIQLVFNTLTMLVSLGLG